MRIRPLQPLLPASNAAAAALTCPPYDVLSVSEARALVSDNASSFLRVTRPDAAHPTDAAADDLYQSAKRALTSLQPHLLTRAPRPTLYVYAQTEQRRTQYGLVALVHASDYEAGTILRHERTRPDKEADRTRLTDVLSANTGPVFLTYADAPSVNDAVAAVVQAPPLFSVTAEDPSGDVLHRVWPVPHADTATLVRLFGAHVPAAYIADGHHRAASAANVARLRRERGGDAGDDDDAGCFLAVLFPASQLCVLPYNRLVSDLEGRTPDEFVEALRQEGNVERLDTPPDADPERAGVVYVFVGEDWFRLELHEEEACGAASEMLDCAVLQRRVLAPLLGIHDPRKSDRVRFVGGVKGVPYLESCVREGKAAVAFALHPVSVKQLMNVADRGEIMPPKSTWFEPKLRSGFFVHTF